MLRPSNTHQPPFYFLLRDVVVVVLPTPFLNQSKCLTQHTHWMSSEACQTHPCKTLHMFLLESWLLRPHTSTAMLVGMGKAPLLCLDRLLNRQTYSYCESLHSICVRPRELKSQCSNEMYTCVFSVSIIPNMAKGREKNPRCPSVVSPYKQIPTFSYNAIKRRQ